MSDGTSHLPELPETDGRDAWQAQGRLHFPTAEYVSAEMSALREEILKETDVEFLLMSALTHIACTWPTRSQG
jgi:hypothetical protein